MSEAWSAAEVEAACDCAVAALSNEPFYRAMLGPLGVDPAAYTHGLAAYFAHTITHAHAVGRVVQSAVPGLGIAVWSLPQRMEERAAAVREKRAFLEGRFGPAARATYDLLVGTMADHALTVVPERAWYLSILAVAPKAQGRGMGRELLRPTLAEADAREAPTYVETSTPRNLRFYQREGFRVELSYREPVSGADYWVLVRPVGG